MTLIVASIVKGLNEQNSDVNKCRVDDWTAEKAIIAQHGHSLLIMKM